MMILTVQGKNPEEIANNLKIIAGMLREGYDSGYESPCTWDLSGEIEGEEEEEEHD